MDSLFNDIFNNNEVLKNRMKNKILFAKKMKTKEEFIRILAADYIKLSKEL